MKNLFIPTKLIQFKNWWTNQKTENDKGGSFNMELYLRILEIKAEKSC